MDWNAELFGKSAGTPKPTATPKDFAETYAPFIQKVSDRIGVSPEVLTAQFGLETAWGKHIIPGTNNLGNIKDFSGRGVPATDSMTGSRDQYRAYSSPEQFANDYARLIETHYPNALNAGDDAAKFASALKARGYAEDPNYVAKIVATHQSVRGIIPPTQPSAPKDWAAELFGPNSKAVTPKENDPSFADRALRTAGLGARAVVKGVTAIPTLMADVAAVPLRALTGGRYFQSPSAVLDRNLTAAGLPEPANATERVTQDIVGGMAGGGTMMAGGRVLANSASPVVAGVGGTMASQPLAQSVASVTGPAAAGVTRENGGGPTAQFLAGLAGGVAPSVVASVVPSSIKGAFRGGEQGRQTTANNIKLFEDAGYGVPTVGQASESRVSRGIESTMSRAPGGAGPMVKSAETGAANLGKRVGAIADDLALGADATKAGVTIEKGVKNFVGRFKAEQNFLYDKLDSHIPANTPIKVDNTKTALAELNADIPGAPALSEFFKNAKIKSVEGALISDTKSAANAALTPSQARTFVQTPEGQLPYEAIKKLRTLVGKELENPSLVSDVPRSKWKALYSAISDDLAAAAKNAGPEAEKAFSRANTYTRAGHERLATYLDRVVGKDTAEKVFNAAVNPSEIKEGASTVNAVMRSLQPAERDIVKSAFLKRLGTATAGNQDATGELFSANTFLTNWNKISPQAKMTLFASKDGELAMNLDKIAKVTANIRDGSKVFANPSGTQQALSSQALGGGVLVAALTGNLGVAGSLIGAASASNSVAKLMTNPDFVRWLAKSTTAPTSAIPSALNTLSQMSSKMKGEDKKAVEMYIDQTKRTMMR
jgi:hypothetical protein